VTVKARPAPRIKHGRLSVLVLLVVSAAALAIVFGLLPGLSATSDGDVVLATLVLVTLSALLRPALALLATRLGWLGIALTGLLAQALIFYVALSATPGITVSGFWPAFWASWLYALLVSLAGWVFDANDDEVFVRDVLRTARRQHRTAENDAVTTDRPGVVFVQIDGLPAPLLRLAIQSGDLPTLSRWVRSGSHKVTDWRAQLPATTPASQAGILHGHSEAVPAFRWYEKESQRLTVTNHPKDAAYVEAGLSDGCGLLADGGVSIGNIFSGDAPTALLTISATSRQAPSRRFATAYLRPFGFTRSFLLTIGEMIKELSQGRRQRVRDIQPRIDRRTSYVFLRGVTNVLLRDLNVRLLADQMLSGTPAMYCDFTDYDEVAHHAGPTRPESLASLLGVDRAIGVLERIAQAAQRPYEFVVLSDHGQSQGSTFRQRYGEALEDLVRRLIARSATTVDDRDAETVGATDRAEEWGRPAALFREIGNGKGSTARLSRQVVDRHEGNGAQASIDHVPDLIVTASGNLGFIYFPRHPGRLSYESLERLYPGLVDALADHDGIGFVAVRSERDGLLALGRGGRHLLDRDRIEGVDPLGLFGASAAEEVRRHGALAHVGDIVVNSRIDASTGEVAAFEELVGCHGGLGGWQSEAALLYPSGWSAPATLVGADAVHRQLVQWLEELGQRAHVVSRANRSPTPVRT
jgi:uncharacterized membrane protein YvlD (DUF360 family)